MVMVWTVGELVAFRELVAIKPRLTEGGEEGTPRLAKKGVVGMMDDWRERIAF